MSQLLLAKQLTAGGCCCCPCLPAAQALGTSLPSSAMWLGSCASHTAVDQTGQLIYSICDETEWQQLCSWQVALGSISVNRCGSAAPWMLHTHWWLPSHAQCSCKQLDAQTETQNQPLLFGSSSVSGCAAAPGGMVGVMRRCTTGSVSSSSMLAVSSSSLLAISSGSILAICSSSMLASL